MTTASTATPKRPGHALAQAWYAALECRLAAEKERLKGTESPVPSNLAPIGGHLDRVDLIDFLDALGALVVTMRTCGDPCPGRWDPSDDIAWHARAEAESDWEVRRGE